MSDIDEDLLPNILFIFVMMILVYAREQSRAHAFNQMKYNLRSYIYTNGFRCKKNNVSSILKWNIAY